MVLIAVMASAPASTTAAAMRPMEGTLGASLIADGNGCGGFNHRCDGGSAFTASGEGSAKLITDIGTGNIDLNQMRLGLTDHARHFAKLFGRAGKDAGNERYAQRFQQAARFNAAGAVLLRAPGLLNPTALMMPRPQSMSHRVGMTLACLNCCSFWLLLRQRRLDGGALQQTWRWCQ